MRDENKNRAAPMRELRGRHRRSTASGDSLLEWQRDLLSTISHDLRNPITPILGHAALLERRLAKLGMVEEAERAAGIVRNVHRLNAIILEMTEAGFLETGDVEIKMRPVDLRELMEGIGRRPDPSAEGRIAVSTPPSRPMKVLGDSEQIEKATGNLITYLLAASPPDSPVEVSLWATATNAVVAFTSRDTEVPAEELPLLLQRFHRLGLRKKLPGAGLGLYIARLIVEGHGGRLSAERRRDRDITFTLTLPLA